MVYTLYMVNTTSIYMVKTTYIHGIYLIHGKYHIDIYMVIPYT